MYSWGVRRVRSLGNLICNEAEPVGEVMSVGFESGEVADKCFIFIAALLAAESRFTNSPDDRVLWPIAIS